MADVEVLKSYERSCMLTYHLRAGSMHALLLKKEKHTEIRWLQKYLRGRKLQRNLELSACPWIFFYWMAWALVIQQEFFFLINGS